jgi:hypothetical protein
LTFAEDALSAVDIEEQKIITAGSGLFTDRENSIRL